ncbi:MAG: Hint domain-containing protein [Breznakibacter sp.]
MQDESEGAKEATPLLNVAWTKASVPDGLFLSPGGMPIGLTGITELAFLKSAESGIDSRTVLKSVLYGFAKGEQRYFANFNGGRFTGYFLEGTTSEKEVFTDTEGVTKKIVQSGRYDVTLLGIDGEAPTTRLVDNNLWYDQPDWSNYTAQGTQITIVDDYTFIPCGSLLRQYKDSPLMESHVLKTAILSNPCVLKDPSLHFGSYVPESQWMKEFNMVFGTMVNVAFFPAAMEVAGGILLNEAKDRLAKAAVASAIDGTLQSVCIYLEAEEGDDWQSLCGQYDVKQMMVSALEGAVDNVYTVLTVPLYDSFYKDGKPKENLDIVSFLKDYGFGVTVNLLTRGATDGYFSKYYKRMVAAAKKGNLEDKLVKLGLSAENRKGFSELMGGMTQKSLQRFEALTQKLRTFPVDGTATDLSRFADELDAVADHYPKKSIDELVAAFGCFTAATPVATPEGVRPIADIQTGDTVMSYNHTAQRIEPRVVANLKNYAAKALVILSLSTGQQIEATPTHPFYANGRYAPASDLAPGDTLTAPNGHKVLLQAVQPLDTVATVYNLTVAHNSNYYVGNPGVLVHNDCMMALLNAPIYKSLVDKLDKLTPELKAAFMADFEKAGKELLDVLNSPNGIEAWTMLNGLNYKLLKKNKQVLENLS